MKSTGHPLIQNNISGISGSIVLNIIPDLGDNVGQQFEESTNSVVDVA